MMSVWHGTPSVAAPATTVTNARTANERLKARILLADYPAIRRPRLAYRHAPRRRRVVNRQPSTPPLFRTFANESR
jgi:hypothetical protein